MSQQRRGVEREEHLARLTRLASRLDSDDFFMAHALYLRAEEQKLDEAGLANALGCTVEQLTRLKLCRRPRSDEPNFRVRVQNLADHFQLPPLVLLEVIRQAEGRASIASAGETTTAMLLAARDGEKQEPNGDQATAQRQEPEL
jgi:hypothetical protein